MLQHFETETEDMAGVEWSPDGRVLGVWETCLKVGDPSRTVNAWRTRWMPSQNHRSFVRDVTIEVVWVFMM